MTNDYEGWLVGIISKRPADIIRVLMDLLEAGIKNGRCTANDVRDIQFDEPNVIGSTFRLLPRMGFVKTERRVKMTQKRKHARDVAVWELTDGGRYKAEKALRDFRCHLLNLPEVGQLDLAM